MSDLRAVDLDAVRRRQSGVVARRQLIAGGWGPTRIRRALRNELVVVHPGVYADAAATRSRDLRAWAAVLWAWPAALYGPSAIRVHAGVGAEEVIHVCGAVDRTLREPNGVVFHPIAHLDRRVQWNLSPPRQRWDDAIVDEAVAHLVRGRDRDAIARLSDGVALGRTTVDRLLANVAARGAIHRRKWLCDTLGDLGEGVRSVLEHDYLVRVERAHALPTSVRQVREVTESGTVYRDCESGGLVIEIDGRSHHDTDEARHRDLTRDLDTLLTGRSTVRLGRRHVGEEACLTAIKIGRLLAARGWSGAPASCGGACLVAGAA